MENKTEHIDNLIAAYMNHHISSQDMSELKDWTADSDAHRDYVRKRVELFFETEVKANPIGFNEEEALNRFYKNILVKDDASTVNKEGALSFRILFASKWMRVIAAAILILLIAVPWASYKLTTSHVINEFAQIVMQAPDGSQLNLTLPDGSTIKLNSGSQISYSQGFGIDNRDIKLSGEGFFNVKHNDKIPLRVIMPELILTDLGTEFDIRNYKDEQNASVDLIKGKASLQNMLRKSKDVTITAGNRVVLDKLSGKMNLLNNMTDSSIGGIDDMYFENSSLADVAKILSRNYGVSIKVDDKIKNIGIYGFFNRKEDTIGKILETITRSCQVSCKKVKNVYVIY